MTTPKKSPSPVRRRAASASKPQPAAKRAAKRLLSQDVVGALLVEHRYAARLLDVLEQQLGLVARGRPLDREAVLAAMSYMTEYPDAYHHPREDAMFVRLEKRDPHLHKRIVEIDRAHRTIGLVGKQILAAVQRGLDRGADEAEVVSRIAEYVRAQREHMTIEEHDLFPRAQQLLDDADLAAIEREFRRVTDPVFEASVRDAYAAYPAVVRMLVEQPAVRQVLDAFDSFYESASTLGDVLFGGATPKAPAAREPEGKKDGRETARSR